MIVVKIAPFLQLSLQKVSAAFDVVQSKLKLYLLIQLIVWNEISKQLSKWNNKLKRGWGKNAGYTVLIKSILVAKLLLWLLKC